MGVRGVFICVEGLDGCGKTTQTKLLVKKLEEKGYPAMYTAEPSNGEIGKFIRRYSLHRVERASNVVETLLFAADRFEHVENRIIPALDEGKLVISDRYVYSSLAYQGATGLVLKWIEEVNRYALRPNLTIFIDVDAEVAIHRLKREKSVMENLRTQTKVREVYMRFAAKGELVRIDGNKPVNEVADDIIKVVLKFLAKGID